MIRSKGLHGLGRVALIVKKIGILLLITTFFLVGCQKTPESPIVINKNDGKLEQAIQSAPVEERQDIPTTVWGDVLQLSNMTCRIDVRTQLPASEEFPVLKAQKKAFTSEICAELTGHFADGATGVRETSDTREDIEQQLIQAKRGEYVLDDDGGRWEPYEGQQEDIRRLEQALQAAPQETFAAVTPEALASTGAHTFLMPDGKRAYIRVKKTSYTYSTDRNAVVQPETWLSYGEAIPRESAGTTIGEVKLAEDDACTQAEALLHALYIENMGIADTEKGRIVNLYTSEILSTGWCITFARNDAGSIPVSFEGIQLSGALAIESGEYSESWPAETIRIYMDETGVREFVWKYPIEVTETLNENVRLLPFDAVQDRIWNAIKAGFAQAQTDDAFGENPVQITVDKIVLGNAMVPIQNEPEYRMLMPAWMTFYSIDEDSATYVFAINAVDGSIIDLQIHRSQK